MREIIEIIELSQSQDWEGVSDAVEIAKGKNQYCRTYKQIFKLIKRQIKVIWLRK